MKLLDKYIIRKFFATFAAMFGMMTLLIMVIHLTENAPTFKKHNLSFQEVATYYGVLLPYMVNLLLPITVFATTIWVTTRLAQRSEIIALLSGGISFHRLALPYFVVALSLAAGNGYLTCGLLADANKIRTKFEAQYLNAAYTMPSEKPSYIQLRVGRCQYLYMAQYHAYNNTGYNVWLDTFQDATLVEHIHAEKIVWNSVTQAWLLEKWEKRSFFFNHEKLTKGYRMELPLEIHPDDISINPQLREGLTLKELDAHIKQLLEKGNEAVRFFIAERHIRYMTPFAIPILIMLGFLVAVRKHRGGMGRQITLGFILACLYISLFLSAKIVAEAQNEYVLLKIWMPNIIFMLLCILFYRLMSK